MKKFTILTPDFSEAKEFKSIDDIKLLLDKNIPIMELDKSKYMGAYFFSRF